MSDEPKSKLDREIEEILAKKAQAPINLNDRRKERASKERKAYWSHEIERWTNLALRNPMVIALVCAVLAVIVSDASRLFALLLCVIAVAALWVPGLRLLMGFTSNGPETQYWRGKPYQSTQAEPDAVASIKRFLHRR